MTKDGAIFAKGKVKGDVNFPPFESFDEDSLAEVEKYKVFPLGNIGDFARHIPYNSEKKSFLEKTGRESFEGKHHDNSYMSPLTFVSFPVHLQGTRR